MSKYHTNDWLVSDDALKAAEPEHIDDIEEVNEVVGDIADTDPTDSPTPSEVGQEYMLTIQQLGAVASEYARRVRLLTWAVVAIVVYLVLTNAKD